MSGSADTGMHAAALHLFLSSSTPATTSSTSSSILHPACDNSSDIFHSSRGKKEKDIRQQSTPECRVWLMVAVGRHCERKTETSICFHFRVQTAVEALIAGSVSKQIVYIPDVAVSSALPQRREREKSKKTTKKTLQSSQHPPQSSGVVCVRRRYETMVIITVITLRRLLGFGPCQHSGDRLGEIMNVVRRAIHSGNAGRPRE